MGMTGWTERYMVSERAEGERCSCSAEETEQLKSCHVQSARGATGGSVPGAGTDSTRRYSRRKPALRNGPAETNWQQGARAITRK